MVGVVSEVNISEILKSTPLGLFIYLFPRVPPLYIGFFGFRKLVSSLYFITFFQCAVLVLLFFLKLVVLTFLKDALNSVSDFSVT